MTRPTVVIVALVVIVSAIVTKASFIRPVTRVVHHYHAPLPRLVHRHVHLHHEPARLVRYYAPAPPPPPGHLHPVEEIVEPVPYYPYAWRKK